MDSKKFEQYEGFFEKLKNNGKFTRLGKLFRTTKMGYIYDLGTGKILACTDEEYTILKNIFENNGLSGIEEIGMDEEHLISIVKGLKEIIEEERLLQAPPLTEFSSLHSEFDSLKEQIENNLQQITLEVTERCNLRCKYCIYTEGNETFRDFDTHNMSWEIAQKAIDYGIKHSGERLAVTFYGGEPLLQMNLIKKCVEYTKKISGDKYIHHSMTTNMTLMTKEIAEYLAAQDCFSVVCSLDGPQEIHDENRVFTDGNGSFEKAIRGLKYLADAYGDKAATYLSLSMVMTLPVTDKKMKAIQEFFESLEWLPYKVVKNISYVASSSHRLERLTQKANKETEQSKSGYVNPIADWSQNNTVFSDSIVPEKIFTSTFMQAAYLRVHKRMIVNNPVGCYNLGGCCIPASRRLYITATGNFALCEKIGNAPYIGNVNTGLNMDKIKKFYINDYMKESKKICADCWAVRFCGNCYVDCYEADRFVPEYKRDLCGSTLYGTEKALVSYHEMLERHPERLNYLNDIELS